MSLGNILNGGSVTFPSRDPDSPKAYKTHYKRRAYGSVVAGGNDMFDCQGGGALSFSSFADPTKQRGGRYAPEAHLTSITTKNVGGSDITDAALWEIEFQYICYSKGQLDGLADGFMVPGSLLSISFGWNTGDAVSISGARLYDFSWSYNVDDGTYSGTGKAIASVAGAMGGLTLKTADTPTVTTDGDGNERKDYSIMGQIDSNALGAFKAQRDSSGKLTGGNVPSRDGEAKQNGNYAIANILVELGTIFDDRMYVTYARLEEVIKFINANLSDKTYSYQFKDGQGGAGGTFQPLDIRSADPAKLLLCGEYAAYHTGKEEDQNNFSDLTGTHGKTSDIWISTQLLIDIENSIMDKRSDSEVGVFSASKFLSKLFGEISNLTGGLIECILIPDATNIVIVNKHNEIKKSAGTTTYVRSLKSAVKSVSMSSALDPDMAAIAFSGGSGKFPKKMIDNIFSGCKAKNQAAGTDPQVKMAEKIKMLGLAYQQSTVAELKSILREYVMSQLTGISLRYTIDLSITTDGFADAAFGKTFKVDIVPNSIGSAGSISFMVGEVEHKCDGATWETGVTGYMMVDA